MDESLFIKELGIKSPILKVMDFLMDNEAFDYSKTDIAEGAKMSRATLFKVWPRLENLDLITATRTVGQAKMYRLNKKSPLVKKLMELDDAITQHFAANNSCSEGASMEGKISETMIPDDDEAEIAA
jgi:hypothetical protein